MVCGEHIKLFFVSFLSLYMLISLFYLLLLYRNNHSLPLLPLSLIFLHFSFFLFFLILPLFLFYPALASSLTDKNFMQVGASRGVLSSSVKQTPNWEELLLLRKQPIHRDHSQTCRSMYEDKRMHYYVTWVVFIERNFLKIFLLF